MKQEQKSNNLRDIISQLQRGNREHSLRQIKRNKHICYYRSYFEVDESNKEVLIVLEKVEKPTEKINLSENECFCKAITKFSAQNQIRKRTYEVLKNRLGLHKDTPNCKIPLALLFLGDE